MSQSFQQLFVFLFLICLTTRVQGIGLFCGWMEDEYLHCFLRGKNPADDIDLNYHEDNYPNLIVYQKNEEEGNFFGSINVDKLVNDHIDDDNLSYYHEIPNCDHCQKPADCIAEFLPADNGKPELHTFKNTYVHCGKNNIKTLEQFRACGNDPFRILTNQNNAYQGGRGLVLVPHIPKCGVDETRSYLAGEGGYVRMATWPFENFCGFSGAGRLYSVNGALVVFTKKINLVFPNSAPIFGFPAKWFDGVQYIKSGDCDRVPAVKVKIPENEVNSFVFQIDENKEGPMATKAETLTYHQWKAKFAFAPKNVLV